MKQCVWMLVFLVFSGSLYGQDQLVGMPVKVSFGIGAGPSTPTGALSNRDDAGWNAGANIRLEGWIPFRITGLVQYNRLPNISVAPVAILRSNNTLPDIHPGESDLAWLFGAGLEYPIDLPIIRPYLGVDGFVTSLSSTAGNSTSITREGIDFGVGVQIPFAIFGNVNVSVKYQIFNLAGKEQNEDTYAQVMANIALTFDIL